MVWDSELETELRTRRQSSILACVAFPDLETKALLFPMKFSTPSYQSMTAYMAKAQTFAG